MTTFDFGYGPVPAHKHPNGGGLVADTARVSGNVWVYGNAQVSGNAWVYGDARVYGNAQVYGLMRNDGYCFVYVLCADKKKRVIAGCHYFTMAEAKVHWKATRGTTPLGRETMRILKCLEILDKE